MIEQIIIAICGASSIWLSQSISFTQRKWAPVIGIIAQPFWLYATWQSEQWGMFALSILYAAGWARGIRTYWWSRGG
jgi:hypothetical protein